MTPLPFSPFVDETLVDHDNRFIPNENALFDAIKAPTDRWPFLKWPVWSTNDDPPPLFLTDPSSGYIDALDSELRPILQAIRRR